MRCRRRWRRWRGAGSTSSPTGGVDLLIEVAASILAFVYVSLEVRHLFDPGFERRGFEADGLELYAYSIVWLLFGVALLALGFLRQAAALRHAGMVLVCIVVAKVFLIDMAGLEGPAARVLVPRPGRGADRPRLCLSTLRIRQQMTEALFPEVSMSLDALRALQLDRLRDTLRQAYDNQAPYRAKCEAAGVHPDDLTSLDDLARFPFTAKADLRDAYPFGMLAIPREQCVRLHASSGTTGRPTVVGYSAQRHRRPGRDLMARSLYRRRRAAGRHHPQCLSATACSPAGSARTTAPSGWAARWCRCRAASASGRSSSSASSAPASC